MPQCGRNGGFYRPVARAVAGGPADPDRSTGEMVTGLDGMLKSRLRLWAKNNKGTYPKNILFYRDGVSEGQYDIVLDQELPLLWKACKEVYPAGDTKKALPRMSIIIVDKRHNTRFIQPEKKTPTAP